MKKYSIVNNIFGWIAFAIAAVVYCMTIEPTASFWDCPEFITTGYKLEVGHPPGAPFFMLTANIFSQFVSDPSQVAYMVNIMSALLSAGCILFLFWSITHLTKKLVCPDETKMTTGKLITIIASGMTGALAYTFSDTFWYSAVEGEVYAYSSLFTAVVFWLILKWEEQADKPHSDRWLILIAYLTGLSVGVHLLNLLCIPAIVLIWYYKRNPNANLKGSLGALIVSALLIAAVLYGIVPGIVKVGGWFELLFVNTLGTPFNTGLIVYIILLAVTLIWGVYETFRSENRKRMNIAFLLSVALLGIPFYGYGFNSILIGMVVLAVLAFFLFYKKGGNYRVSVRTLNTTLLCLTMIVVGYSSYAVIVIRSTANTPMDQNSPEDIFTLGTYLGREQYGDRPLFYGQAYSSKIALKTEGNHCIPVYEEGAPVYHRKEKKSADEPDRYELIRYKQNYKYAQNMLFPRMYSPEHADKYKQWLGGIKEYKVPYDECGNMVTVQMPTQLENLRFFFSYQINFMYWRYFMWNFAGRQNDIQGNGELEHGNWITGISFIDNLLVGNQDNLPSDLKNNKGHNVFYCLPLLLGLIGLFWQAYRGEQGVKQFWVVFFLFFMTGIAIVLYLNQTPSQPRERDYAYAGSFYAFAIWIGMGVAGLTELLRKKMKETPAAILAAVACLCVPVQMVSQTWDDHDRSGRYTCRDFGQNYLNSISEKDNPIIFTNGDNDTFPLWYNQETEGVRTDARVCNLSYLQTDWYIDQMRRPAYDSPSLPIEWKRYDYVEGSNDYVRIESKMKNEIRKLYKNQPEKARQAFGDNPFEVKNIMKHWICSGNPNFQVIPTDTLEITVDKEAVLRSGMFIPDSAEIPDKMYISLKGRNALYKNDLMMLEMLANANWSRPIYMAISVGPQNHLGLSDHFIQEGLAYRITPFNWAKLGYLPKQQQYPREYFMDTEKTYDVMLNKFKFGGIDNPDIYLDETVSRMCHSHRRIFAQLIRQLIREGKKDKALKALDYMEKVIPSTTLPHDYLMSGSMEFAEAYLQLGEKEKATGILKQLGDKANEYIDWYLSLDQKQLQAKISDCQWNFSILNTVATLLGNSEEGLAYQQSLDEKFARLRGRLNQ
ncbi:MAG: DUF2723 domain-containing protein [Bacteroidaceae bacterium]|nr:DUF2723 domain-containing protein [Bacteroidaceae bacterium]MBQ8362277.1 DUF2723 domain-containing protein [Bacteroidaceae bacterium]